MSRLRIGITCYPTIGGSGIVATEVGQAMAERGHDVHFICERTPHRLRPHPRIHVHRVAARDYPVFPVVPYSLALCSRMVEVARVHGLDVLHAHYAVPHATSAWMAREILDGELAVVTTLHGTDITLVGSDASYLPVTRHSIARSDAVTAPSRFLQAETWARFDLDPSTTPIEVIPNMVDVDRFRPWREGDAEDLLGRFPSRRPVVVHVSNFRPLKRVHQVVDVFVESGIDAHLALVGDGPTREAVLEHARVRGVADRVHWVGVPDDLPALLRQCAVFVLPSETESFGLAALEALSCAIPVIATRVGGLPEVVDVGETGFLEQDVPAMAARLRQLIDDDALRARMGSAARQAALLRFRAGPILDAYEATYHRAVRTSLGGLRGRPHVGLPDQP